MGPLLIWSLVVWLGLPGVGLQENRGAARHTPRDAEELAQALVGIWDNANQIAFETNGYPQSLGEPPVREPHTRMRVFIARVELPWLGERVLYLEHFAGNLENPYRQQLLSIELNEGQLEQRNFRLHTPERFLGAWREPQRLEALTAGQVSPAIGEHCVFIWQRSAAQFVGEIPKGACVIDSRRHPGEKRVITSRRVVSADALFMDESGYLLDGALAFGRRDGVPHQLLRARTFDCWFAVHPDAGSASMQALAEDADYDRSIDWAFEQTSGVIDQGGRVSLPRPNSESPAFHAILRQTQFPVGDFDDVLELFVHQEGIERPIAYAWTDQTAERIGIQLRFLQGSCSLEPKD